MVVLVLREHDHDDLNVRSAFLHVLGDALASVGVIAAGIVILLTGWMWVDPLISALIGLIIVLGSGRVLRQAVHILAEGMPEGIKASTVAEAMAGVWGVVEVHDLHVWTVSPGYAALSAHVVLADQALSQTQEAMDGLKRVLGEQFGIEHTTIQFECDNCGQGAVACMNGGDHHAMLGESRPVRTGDYGRGPQGQPDRDGVRDHDYLRAHSGAGR